MPWVTPTLRETRELVRGEISTKLAGAAFIGNSVLRVMADATAALTHLVLRFIEWLALQLLPDTAETEWLDRHGDIWLVNADNTTGRKGATGSAGSVLITGTIGTVIPQYTRLSSGLIDYETIEQILIGQTASEVHVRAIDPGAAGNLDPGEVISFVTPFAGVDGDAEVVTLVGGTDQETDEDLRFRILDRIRQPPMGGDSNDYVQWALQVPGVTRAWSSPNEMGMGTVTVRFMCDVLRKTDDPLTDGFPRDSDIEIVTKHLNKMRPVAVKDFFCVAPIPEPIDLSLSNLSDNTAGTYEAIRESVLQMLKERAAPASSVDGISIDAQTIYEAWVSDAVLSAIGEDGWFDLHFNDHLMPTKGSMAVLGTITYV